MHADEIQDRAQPEELPDRLTVSPGMTAVRPPRVLFGDQYIFGMFVPRPDWCPLQEAEAVAISRDGLMQDIELVRPAARLICDLRSVALDIKTTQAATRDGVITRGGIPLPLGQSVLDSALGERAVGTRLISASLRHVESGSPRDTGAGPGNQAHGSTTFYPNSEKAIGLHLDTWAHKRDFVQNGAPFRCIVNIGHEPRYVVFINLSPGQISQMIGSADPDIDAERLLDENPQEWAQRFLSAHGDHPVMRLKILPGEAYVMDTHACIHDGSTVERSSPDTFVILSYIRDAI